MSETCQQREREPGGRRRLRRAGREQYAWKMIDVESAVKPDHKARLIVELVSRFDLRGFEEPIRSLANRAGRAALDPALLISLWIYGYSEGIGWARELSRRMEHEPALLWILGDQEAISHSKLSEFRRQHGEALKDLFAQLLALLASGGFVDLKQVMQDGTKIQAAQAGEDSFRGAATIERKLAEARQAVEELAREDDEEEQADPQQQRGRARRRRAAEQRRQRLEQAWNEMEQLQATKKAKKGVQPRVSITEPEARRMKHGADGGISASYNLQLSTDAKHGVIVDVGLTKEAGDAHQLTPAVDRIKERFECEPEQVVADGGYTTRDNITAMEARQVDFIGSLGESAGRRATALKLNGIGEGFAPAAFTVIEDGAALSCPAGKRLEYVRQSIKGGVKYRQYQARPADCASCPHRSQCSPRKPTAGRTVSVLEERPEVIRFRQKMESEQAREAYRKRGPVAEFPNAWIKEKIGLRKFRLRGLVKASVETLWVCLTFNVLQWLRLDGKPTAMQAA